MGEGSDHPPAILERSDGACLLYDGKVNSVIGASESGKSWLATLAVAQLARRALKSLYVDFESTPGAVGGRFAQMGLTQQQINDQIFYVNPDGPLDELGEDDLLPALEASVLVVVDGFNTWLALHERKIESTEDVTVFAKRILYPWADYGLGILLIDHTPKNTQPGQGAGAIGSQAKRSMITGVSLRVDPIAELRMGRGQYGESVVKVDKDRPGFVRGLAIDGVVGRLYVDDTHVKNSGTDVGLRAATWQDKELKEQDRRAAIVGVAEEILAAGPMAKRELFRTAGWSWGSDSTHAAIKWAVDHGRLAVTTGSRGAHVLSVDPKFGDSVSGSSNSVSGSTGSGRLSNSYHCQSIGLADGSWPPSSATATASPPRGGEAEPS